MLKKIIETELNYFYTQAHTKCGHCLVFCFIMFFFSRQAHTKVRSKLHFVAHKLERVPLGPLKTTEFSLYFFFNAGEHKIWILR